MTPESRRAADLANPAAPKPPIPDYELVRRIGQGGYGDVWLGRGLTGAYRAVKVVWRDRFDDVEPFLREFRGVRESMANGTDPGQLALHHVGQNEAAGFFYYVMELADDTASGRTVDPARYVPLTLKELKTKRGRLPAKDCVNLAVELARALQALHARGLVHRDIKPSNIVLVNGVPKLADVGLVAASTDARTFVGTQGYMPPEGPGTPAADVFALGKVIYELATGFERDEFPKLPAEFNDGTDRRALFELNEILLRACEPFSEKRYRDAGALLQDLLALQTGRSLRRRRMRAALWRAGAVAAALVLAGGATWWWRRPAPVPPASAPTAAIAPNSIAVLPFENLSDDKANGYFADGVFDDILTELTNLSSLRVIARTSMLQYRDTKKPIRQIATELKVAYVLEGTVRRAGNKVRVSGQLIRAGTEESVWARTFDRDLTDVFAIQSELSRDIVGALQGVITPQDELSLAQRSTTSIAAYDLYRRARALEGKSTDSIAVAREQVPLLEEALRLDPNYAEAWALLADALGVAGNNGFERSNPDRKARMLAALARAEALAPDNYVVLMTGANLAAGAGDRAGVNRRRQRILELFPSRAEAHYVTALSAEHDGRYRDALAAYHRALALDPRNVSLGQNLLSMLITLRWYDEYRAVLREWPMVVPDARELAYEQANLQLRQYGSTAELRAWLARLPPNPGGIDQRLTMMRAQALFVLGDAEGMVRLWRETGPRWKFNEVGVLDEISVAMAFLSLGDRAGARPLIEKARDRARAIVTAEPTKIRLWNLLGLSLALLGEKAEAHDALARARELVSTTRTTPDGNRDVEFYNAIWRSWNGEQAEAIPTLDRLLKLPVVTPHAFVEDLRRGLLTLPLRGNPAFEAMLNDPANNARQPDVRPTATPAAPVAPPPAMPEADPHSIAVMPFENLSDTKENGYLADGVQEDVLTDLASVRSLKVVSRASVTRYRGTTKPVSQIGTELGVAYVLNASLRREGNRVRLSAQLVDTRTDRQVWAKNFDREVGSMLALQSDLAGEIVPALQVVISPEEKAALASAPTTNGSAYDLFLRARGLRRDGRYVSKAAAGEAEQLLQQVLAADPAFVRAWVELAAVQVDRYFTFGDERNAATIAKAEGAIAKARALAPDAPEVLLGAGRIRYVCYHDFPGTLFFYEKILAAYPNYPDIKLPLGLLYRRLGRWGDAVRELRAACRQEPGSMNASQSFGSTLVAVRRYAELLTLIAERARYMPETSASRNFAAILEYRTTGSRAGFQRWMAGIPPDELNSPEVLEERFYWAMTTGDTAMVLDLVEKYGLTEDRFDAAIVLAHEGQRGRALELAAPLTRELEKQLAENPSNADTWSSLALHHALAGDRAATFAAIERARQASPESGDAFVGPIQAGGRAKALAWLGDKDAALAEIERLVRKPGFIQVWEFRNGLEWLPLHGDPRFEALLADPRNMAPFVDDENRQVDPYAGNAAAPALK